MNRLLLTLAFLVIPTTALAAEKYALLIGVTTYENAHMNRTPLKFPEADATAVAELLRSSGYEVKVLTGIQATRVAVEAELTKLEQQGTQDGVAFIGLFGHGVQYGDEAFFCPYDTKIRKVTDAAGIVVYDKTGKVKLEPDPKSMTSMKRLLEALNTSGAGNRALIADCCREDPSAARGRAFGSSVRIADLGQGTAAIFSCSNTEQSFEHDDWGHGAFTKAFLDYCVTLEEGSDATVSTMTTPLFRSVQAMVHAKASGKTQRVNPITNGIVDLKIVNTKITNFLGMEFVRVPGGIFRYSEYSEEVQSIPTLRVARHKVTVAQFRRFVEATGYITVAELAAAGNVQQLSDMGYKLTTSEKEAEETEKSLISRLYGMGCMPGMNSVVSDRRFNWRTPGWEQKDDFPVVNLADQDIWNFVRWLQSMDSRNPRLLNDYELQWLKYQDVEGSDAELSKSRQARSQELFKEWQHRARPLVFGEQYSTTPVDPRSLPGYGVADLFGNGHEWTENALTPGELCIYHNGGTSGVCCFKGTNPELCTFRIVMPEPTAPSKQ